MRDLAASFLNTPYWDAFNAISLIAGVLSVFALLFGLAQSTRGKVMMWTGLSLLFVSIAFSMLFEEVLPTWAELPEHRRLPYALSFPGFLVFLVTLILGGRRFVRDVLRALPDLKERRARQRRSGATAALLRTMAPGTSWLGFSLVVFLASIVAYHGPEVALGWAGWGQ